MKEKPTIQRIFKPITKFTKIEASGGIVLFAVTIIALIWANSVLSEYYTKIWDSTFSITFNNFEFKKTLLHFINDGLMVIFFFVVGLEIKRELLIGELSKIKQAMVPVIAALGGMVIPAAIFMIFNHGTPTERGWGIPVATDIAFSLGVLSLLGKKIPISFKIFLTAFAIIDDIGAVLVIAIFYTANLNLLYLGIGLILLLILLILNLLKVNKAYIYILIGLVIWFVFLKSGVHTTIAGVLTAFVIPTKARIKLSDFKSRCQNTMNEIDSIENEHGDSTSINTLNSCINEIKTNSSNVLSPAHMLEYKLHPYVAFLILPLFALSNTGLVINSELISNFDYRLFWGIFLGLVIGKSFGITFFIFLSNKLKITKLPEGLKMSHLLGLAFLGGIGFTMSLFISSLAFSEPIFLDTSKASILAASLVSGISGYTILYFLTRKTKRTI